MPSSYFRQTSLHGSRVLDVDLAVAVEIRLQQRLFIFEVKREIFRQILLQQRHVANIESAVAADVADDKINRLFFDNLRFRYLLAAGSAAGALCQTRLGIGGRGALHTDN